MNRIDMDAAREMVRQWMLAHPDGRPGQMADELKGEYGQFAEDMAIVLRSFMARFRDHPEELASTAPAGPDPVTSNPGNDGHGDAGDSRPDRGNGAVNRT